MGRSVFRVSETSFSSLSFCLSFASLSLSSSFCRSCDSLECEEDDEEREEEDDVADDCPIDLLGLPIPIFAYTHNPHTINPIFLPEKREGRTRHQSIKGDPRCGVDIVVSDMG